MLDVQQSSSDNECQQCDRFVQLLNERCKNATRKEIMTLVPETWSVKKIASEFEASRYLADRSRLLRADRGILNKE